MLRAIDARSIARPFHLTAVVVTHPAGFAAFMTGYDALLTPTLAIRAPKANGPYSLLRDEALDPWVTRLADACRYTMPGNESGLPAISVPTGLDPDGLPIGAQLYGNFCSEALLLQLAAQLERAHPAWFGARPPTHVTTLKADASSPPGAI